MLYTLHKNIIPSFAVEAAMTDLRQVIVQRMNSHFNKNVFALEKWIKENYNGNLIKQDIVRHLPQLPNTDEWVTLMLALVPHIQPDFFSSIISGCKSDFQNTLPDKMLQKYQSCMEILPAVETFIDSFPIYDIPKIIDVFGSPILVVQIVCMFPNINT